MKKKLLLSVAAAVTVLSSSIPVCAAPQYMADGAVFDPEWYQEQNPEVAEALKSLGLGVSADTLYQHYTLFGANERRTPYDEAHFDPASVLPYQGAGADPESAAQTQPAASQAQTDDPGEIIAVEGETYRFPSIHSSEYNYADCMVNVTFNRGEIYEDEEYFADYLAAYIPVRYVRVCVHDRMYALNSLPPIPLSITIDIFLGRLGTLVRPLAHKKQIPLHYMSV